MNKRATIVLVIAINVVLIGSLIAVYFGVFYNRDKNEGTLTITGNTFDDIELTIPELEVLPSITKNYYLQGNPSFYADYTGVQLWYLVTEVANVTSEATIRVIAVDQYSYSLSSADLGVDSEIIIAYRKNGELITSREEGGEGPLRLIIPQRFEGEWNGQYCVKFVKTIEINS
jgi:hypothetical protein